MALPGPFRLASLNKERQARPARRTALELEKAGAGAKVLATGATVDTHSFILSIEKYRVSQMEDLGLLLLTYRICANRRPLLIRVPL